LLFQRTAPKQNAQENCEQQAKKNQ
jgi:hypothetical protein